MRPTLRLGATAGLLVLVAACGGGSDSAAPTPTPTPTSAAPAPSSAAPTVPSTPAAPLPGSKSSAPVAPVDAPVPCATSELTASVRPSEGGGAAGTTGSDLVLTNRSALACTLDGHPGVSYVAGADGTQVGASAVRQGSPTRVLLAPGASATAQLLTGSWQDYDAATCSPTPVDGYRVYPPDQTASLFVAAPGTGCASDAVTLLRVGPVTRG